MKKIDKLVIGAFIRPFILIFSVIVFILLTVQMMNYVDQIFGKNLSYIDLGILVMHFSVFQTSIAFPLSVMLASLITFGQLGEHFELTAIKSAGISLTRIMIPIFLVVILLTITAFFSNNYLVPNSALKAYSLLYDIRQKKPTLDIEPGLFYGGIDKYKIKIDKKLPDGKTLLGIIIYNHTNHNGNKDVTIADSGKMYTIMDNQYLKFELFNGANYTEGKGKISQRRIQNYQKIGPFTRTHFKKSEVIFDLSSFGMSRTDEKLFASNKLMRNFNELNKDLDSISDRIALFKAQIYDVPKRFFTYSKLKQNVLIPKELIEVQEKKIPIKKSMLVKQEKKEKESLLIALNNLNNLGNKQKTKNKNILKKEKINKLTNTKITKEILRKKQLANQKIIEAIEKKYQHKNERLIVLERALATVRQIKSRLSVQNSRIEQFNKNYLGFKIQWHKMIAISISCISLFLIGAPLGAIIKKGGLGFPVLISILFFIIYYVISIGGEKYVKVNMLPVFQGIWMANLILFPVGVFFLKQAKNDVRLFEMDYYLVTINNFYLMIMKKFSKK